MSERLSARLVRRVHPGLTIDLELLMGAERLILFGASGAGKSTILRLLAGLERPDLGRIQLDESELLDTHTGKDAPLRLRRIGMIFQDDLLFPHLSVAANVRFGLKGRPPDEVASRMNEVADLCGIRHLLDRAPETLSGGERQRVGLARALAPRPRLLLCDEPVSALDLNARQTLIDRLREVQGAESIPLIYVTHSPDEAISLGERLLLLEGGKIIADGPPLDVLAQKRGSFLSSLQNAFHATVSDTITDPGETNLNLDGGPTLVVPAQGLDAGSRVQVSIRSDEILLTARLPDGLPISARNILAGVVERVIPHGSGAEVAVRTRQITWLVSLVEPAVKALGIAPGVEVGLIIKARSCRVERLG